MRKAFYYYILIIAERKKRVQKTVFKKNVVITRHISADRR